MTNEQLRTDRHPTDEPDGTPAFEASLRPPGENVSTPADDDADLDTGADFSDDTGADADGVLPGQSRAGYDVDAVSGDTDAVRPE
jgi:hypothetical protein